MGLGVLAAASFGPPAYGGYLCTKAVKEALQTDEVSFNASVLRELGRQSDLTERDLDWVLDQSAQIDAALNKEEEHLWDQFFIRNSGLSKEHLAKTEARLRSLSKWIGSSFLVAGLFMSTAAVGGWGNELLNLVHEWTGYSSPGYAAEPPALVGLGLATIILGWGGIGGVLNAIANDYAGSLESRREFEKDLANWRREQNSLFLADRGCRSVAVTFS